MRARWAVAALVLCVAGPAEGHKKQPFRELVLQLDDQGLTALWRMVVRGPQVQLLALTHDLDRDGVFNPTEAQRLAGAIVAKATSGVELQWDGVALRQLTLVLKLEPVPPGMPTLAGMGLGQVGTGDPACFGAGPHTLQIRVSKKTGDLSLLVQSLGPGRITKSSRGQLSADGSGLTDPVVLGPGEALELALVLDEVRKP